MMLLKSFSVLAEGGPLGEEFPAVTPAAPLMAPLSFRMLFESSSPGLRTSAGPVSAVSVDFVPDIASGGVAVALLPRFPLTTSGGAESSHLVNRATLTREEPSAVTSSSVAPARDDDRSTTLTVDSSALYRLTVYLRDLSVLRDVPLKHLLQVSVMRVHVFAPAEVDAETNCVADAAAVEVLLGSWSVVWQVRRSLLDENELLRTVLDPLT